MGLYLLAVVQVTATVCVDGGDDALVTFTGVGFDKRLLADSMKVGDASHLSGPTPSTIQRQAIPGQVSSP